MVEITNEEKKLKYAKYFFKNLAAIPNDKLKIANGNPLNTNKILDIEDKNIFLESEMKDDEIGFGITECGTGYISNKTFIKNATSNMMDWWFAWHCIGSDLRYKLWDHDDHYYARADKIDYILNENIPLNEKTWGVTHNILEDIGFGPTNLTLCFKKPSDFGFNINLLGTKYCNSMVCAIGQGDVPAFMVHKYYEVKNGLILESKFWLGYEFKNNKLVKILDKNQKIPEIVARNLFKHNIKEFANLSEILPNIYEEEKNNWLK